MKGRTMAAMGFDVKSMDVSGVSHPAPATAEYSGFGWNDSSWDLKRGLEVIEDIPLDDWPPSPFADGLLATRVA